MSLSYEDTAGEILPPYRGVLLRYARTRVRILRIGGVMRVCSAVTGSTDLTNGAAIYGLPSPQTALEGLPDHLVGGMASDRAVTPWPVQVRLKRRNGVSVPTAPDQQISPFSRKKHPDSYVGGKSFHDATENRLSRVNPSTMNVVPTNFEGKFFHNKRRRKHCRGGKFFHHSCCRHVLCEIPLRANAISLA